MKPNITLIIVDTYEKNAFAKLALEYASKLPLVSEIITFSKVPILQGAIHFPINPINSLMEYSEIILHLVQYFIRTDFTMIIQWDGFPINIMNWNNDFLNYDYIGAPWITDNIENSVGNGGFSLRSTKLFSELKSILLDFNQSIPIDYTAEDKVICIDFRKLLISKGIKFAPEKIAKKFSYEERKDVDTSEVFGFHGIRNVPFFISEEFLYDNIDELLIRLGNKLAIKTFAINCVINNYNVLANKILNDF